MKRPAHKGKGYDGVVTMAGGYYNPATDILEAAPVPKSTGARS